MIDVAIFVLIAAQSGSAAEPDKWHWDTSSPICVMVQETGPNSIKISRTPANDEAQIELSVPKRPLSKRGRFHGSIGLQPGGDSPADGFFTAQGKMLKIYAQTADPAFIESLSNAKTLSISNGTDVPERVTISAADEAVRALHACEDRKMTAWGIDPVAWRALKQRPIPLSPVRDSFSDLDYPAEALRAHIEFDAVIRLDIGIDGKVQGCRGLNPGGYRGFETASCAALKHAQFQPALERGGKPVAAPVVFDVVFRIDS
jgi:TonB family protein